LTQYYVPWAERNQQTFDSVPPGTILVDVSADDTAYYRALRRWWSYGEDFAVIEHDVICRPDVVEQFDACPEPWCTFGYDNICCPGCQEAWANQLGLTRFRAEVMEKCPDALTSIPPELQGWHNLCDHLAGNKINGTDTPTLREGSLRAAGFTHHFHYPAVEHHPWFVSR
jgi:hypothetical protein